MNVDTTTCDVCGAALKHLFTSSYCPNDCDKFPPFQAEDDTKPTAVVSVTQGIDAGPPMDYTIQCDVVCTLMADIYIVPGLLLL